MDKIIEELKAHNIFSDGKIRIIIYSLTILYACLSLWILADINLGFNIFFKDIDKTISIFSNIGLILFFLTFISLIQGGSEQKVENGIIENGINFIKKEKNYFDNLNNLHKKFIYFIYNSGLRYNKKQLIAIFEKSFKQNLDKNNAFNNLKTKESKWISNLRLIDINNKLYKKYREDKFNGEDITKIDIGPFIEEDENKKIILTEVGKKYVEENLIETK